MDFNLTKMRQELTNHIKDIKKAFETDWGSITTRQSIYQPLLKLVDKLAEPINYIMLKIDETNLLLNDPPKFDDNQTPIAYDAKEFDQLIEAYDLLKTELLTFLEEKTRGKIVLSLNQIKNILIASIQEEYRLTAELNKKITPPTKLKLYRSYSF